MKKYIKWILLSVIVLFLVFLWYPIEGKYETTGKIIFSWSGWSALFDKNDFGLRFNYYPETNFDGLDGPYVAGNIVFRVDNNNILSSSTMNILNSIDVNVGNEYGDQFYVRLKESHQIPEAFHEMPQKMVAISDIEGNFNGFASFLRNNDIIDDNFNWIYDTGHLVLVGDFVDRGSEVTQVLWLIYKLEEQAHSNGGKVHFILGNHEIMNFQGNGGYNHEKYIKAAQEISGIEAWETAIQFMYSEKTELGKWLRSKNVVEKIGEILFIHGGLHPEILEYDLDLKTINKECRSNWDNNLYLKPGDNKSANFLLGRKGPLWYRGLVSPYKYYDKITESGLDSLLNYYNADKIVVGHTIVNNVSSDFNGKVIRIDVKHGTQPNSGLTQGLLIENGIEYRINDLGDKQALSQ